jgi:diacylglycerol kinase family enzyme
MTEPATDTTALAADRPVRLGLISNVHSGRNRRQLPRVERIVADHPRILHYPTHDDEELTRALQSLRKSCIDVLAINGGDGTMAHVLGRVLNERIFDTLPAVALLPGGTTNMNAGDVGVRGNLQSALQRLRRWLDDPAQSASTVQRPLLRLATGAGGPPAYGMFFGAGAIIQGVDYCNRHTKDLENEIGPGLAIARTIWGIVRNDPHFSKPVPMGVGYDDGQAQQLDALVLVVSGLERHFGRLNPFWGRESGALHMTLVEASPQRFVRNLPALLRGRPNRYMSPRTGYHSHNIEALRLDMDGTVTLDGELYPVARDTGPCVVDKGAEISFLQI